MTIVTQRCYWWWEISAWLWTWDKNTGQGVGAHRTKPASNHRGNSISEEVTVHDILQLKRNRAAKTMWRGEEHHWEILKRVCACWGQLFFTKESNRPLACMVSNFFIIAHLLTSASLCMSIIRTRILTLCLTLPTPLTLHLVTFSCSHTKKCLAGLRFKSETSLRSIF